MKTISITLKVMFLTLSLILFSNEFSFAQKRFQLTTSTSTQNETIVHNGNIGIGSLITNPLNKLHIEGALRIAGQPTSFGGPTILFEETPGQYPYAQYNIEYLPGQGLNFSVPWPMTGWGNFDLLLTHTHQIGMGTNDFTCTDCNDYRLFVKDGIKTEKVKVEIASENGWADYVFNKDYNLIPLPELQKYINKNQHLPEIPTSKEAVENGIELKEMNVLLLKKVEELTLYLIDLEQRVKDLEGKANQ